MTEKEFEQLLYRGESASLDFKRDRYELLKDVLAFANAWGRQTAASCRLTISKTQPSSSS